MKATRRGIWALSAVLIFFFASGACGLLYQVVWTRRCVLLFGAATYAVSTVISVFFLGLGAGSLWGGRLADRAKRPLAVYGFFEVLIGLWAVGLGLLGHRGEPLIAGLLGMASASRAAGILLRAGLAMGLLIVPVTLMGATLPLLARYVSQNARLKGLRIGALYTLNTLGAVAGCSVTGFFLLERLGYTWTTFSGAAVSIATGFAALAVSRISERGNDAEADWTATTAPVPEAVAVSTSLTPRLVMAAFAASGFCGLALEVVWTRLLVLVFQGTTYAFTAMLASLLCGIAAGSAVASLVADRFRWRTLLYGVAQVLVAAASLILLSQFARLPERWQAAQVDAGFAWDKLLLTKLWLAFQLLFPPTFLMGAAFPLAVRAFLQDASHVGQNVGRLYAANTFGGVVGALAGGYLLLPWLGAQPAIMVLALLLFVTGTALILAEPAMRGYLRAGVALLGAAAVFGPGLLYRPDDVSRALASGYVPREHEVIYYREGVEASVAVSAPLDSRPGSDRMLWVNGVQATASIERGVKMNRFQGVLPMLFDRDPQNVLFMCFGSGITAGTLALWDFPRLDAVEISKDVLGAADLFKADNLGVIHKPNVHFTVDDGRNFLLTTRNRYDLISFEPMPLAMAGVSTFYTREYYELCRNRLNPGGLVSQWVPLHTLDVRIVKSLVKTFISVFPDCTAWFVNADLFLIGSDSPMRIDYGRVLDRLARPEISAALASSGLRDITEVITCFFMGPENVAAFAGDAPVMTDDLPWAEFDAPRRIYERTVGPNLEALKPYYQSPAAWLELPEMTPEAAQGVRDRLDRRVQAKANDIVALQEYYMGMVTTRPMDLFLESLRKDPNDYTARYYLKETTSTLARFTMQGQQYDVARDMLKSALMYAPEEPALHLALGDLLFETGDAQAAADEYRQAVALGAVSEQARQRMGDGPAPEPVAPPVFMLE